MDYTPKYAQPFTFSQACELEIPTIIKEIARLENSLFHLNRTQTELKEHLSGVQGDDIELLNIIRENEDVIASQKERLTMLKLALEEQGINARSGHYDSTVVDGGDGSATISQRRDAAITRREGDSRPGNQAEQGDVGLYL